MWAGGTVGQGSRKQGNPEDRLDEAQWRAVRHGEDVRDDLLDELQRGVSWHKNNLVSIGDVPAQQHLLRGVWEYYEAAKTEVMAIDFDDMLSLTHELLCRNGQAVRLMQSQASHILVDEFQDTNYAQFEVLRMIMPAHGNICVVGDVDQAIYGWRAARPEYLLEFERYFPGAKRVELLANYRSSKAIVGYANKVIARNKLRHEVGIRAVRRGGQRGHYGPRPKSGWNCVRRYGSVIPR